ncbi:hypothetical protein SPRG_04291 [Saprolegnia parasitica CBS 223.65]|uniref:Uncharacterized protein n=1 Tax=Saprolegnia parasitica (strain CBS 223.65) TaxID=695850 RepID=A0A067CWJ5_SAPPC|nr:hypothetical protein SPRG_04291 [Saprolegnia parasitica CBS 223.65]KDO31152.1 hypothetical protein SPRG_04291 [Saprolegnia parasitica CBS 223.65]|eukprot:XP_012198278.1 hypothetical protein SPRG_04291 [Saprolegnia parasitica CBS 223.65]
MEVGHLEDSDVTQLLAPQAIDAYDVVLAGLRDHKNGMQEVSNGVPCSRTPLFIAKTFETRLPSFPLDRPDMEDTHMPSGAHDDFFFYGLDDEHAKLETFLTMTTVAYGIEAFLRPHPLCHEFVRVTSTNEIQEEMLPLLALLGPCRRVMSFAEMNISWI